MLYRRLGDIEVPVLSLGSWNTWDRVDFQEAVVMIARAAELGCAFFDVAHYDMGPHAENSRTDVIFGKAVREAGLKREDWLYCGKLWLWEYPAKGFTQQLTRALDRVGAERADMVVVGDYFNTVDNERIVDDVAEQIDAGRFTTWGVNNWPYQDVRAAIDIARRRGLQPPRFAQLKYSLARRAMAEKYRSLFEANELALQASDVFEGGVLVGKLRPGRKIGADVGGIRNQIVAAWPRVDALAKELGGTPAQVAIAFCLANPHTSNVLMGVSRLAQLTENVRALELVERIPDTADLWLDKKEMEQ